MCLISMARCRRRGLLCAAADACLNKRAASPLANKRPEGGSPCLQYIFPKPPTFQPRQPGLRFLPMGNGDLRFRRTKRSAVWFIFEAASGQLLALFPHQSPGHLAIAPQGTYVALATNRSITLYTMRGSADARTVPLSSRADKWPAVCFTADEQHLWVTRSHAAGSDNLALLDVTTLEIVDAVAVPHDP